MKNAEILVDKEDHDLLTGYNWRISSHGYVTTRERINGIRETLYLHRLITNAPQGLQVDHINRIKTDNRKKNLRLCTTEENQRNRNFGPANKSGFKGVSSRGHHGKIRWYSRIRYNKKQHFLGYFETSEQAAKAYDKAAKEHHKEFAQLNFPEEK